jgi:hypothetical protein
MATLTGLRFYQTQGFEPGEPVDHPLPGGVSMRLVPMRKRLG